MSEKGIRGRFTKIIEDLERITALSLRGDPGRRELTLEDIAAPPRGGMGNTVSLEYFRMIRMLVLNEVLGGAKAAKPLYAAGERIGADLGVGSLEELMGRVASLGIAKAEVLVDGSGPFDRVVIKFLDSAVSVGLPLMGGPVCHFESGLLAGALSRILGKRVRVTETKCIATGYDYCQFETEAVVPGYAGRDSEWGIDSGEYSDENVQLLTTLAAHAAAALENAIQYENTRKMVITDTLTHTYNYGYLQTRLKEEIQRSERQNLCFALVMIDIDEFKALNDQYGHLVGDAALRGIAHIMKESIRGIDILCRYGGDEFALILPQTDKREVVAVVERIRREIERHNFGNAKEEDIPLLKLTASFGCSFYPKDSRFSEQLLNQADQALYEAKQAGRNRVCFFSEKCNPSIG